MINLLPHITQHHSHYNLDSNIVERFWAVVTYIVSIASLSPFENVINNQSPLQVASEVVQHVSVPKGPTFQPPGVPDEENFTCDYTKMVGWEPCSTPMDRKCWLRRKSDGKQYDIYTNYEEEKPTGVTRYYTLEVDDSWYAANGRNSTAAKLFNNKYPGPWVQACWGDT